MRLTITLLLLLLLIAAATWEQIFITTVYDKLDKDITGLHETIEKQIKRGENIDTKANIETIEKIYEYWINKEKQLAFFARHTDLSFVSDALIYTMNFTRFNNPEETCAGIERVKYLIETHSYNVGTSIQNVI